MIAGIHPQTLDPRRVASIVRYHVWPRLCPQDVASHTWQLMRIMLALWPDCPRELLVHAMFHDLGEVATGDIPYPVKAGNPAIRAAVDALDMAACRRMGETFLVPPVTLALPDVMGPGWPTEAFWKLCEFTEMWEYSLHEGNLGNRYAAAIAQTCWAQMVRLRDELAEGAEEDADVMDIVIRYDRYAQSRTDYEREIYEGADRDY